MGHLRRHGLLLLGAGAFSAASLVACCLGGSLILDPLDVAVDDVAIRYPGGLGMSVEARLQVTPHLRATYRSLDGTLSVGDRALPYRVEGLAPGDTLEPGVARPVVMTVDVGAADLAAITLRALGGDVTVAFDGTVEADVLGVPVSGPVSFGRPVE